MDGGGLVSTFDLKKALLKGGIYVSMDAHGRVQGLNESRAIFAPAQSSDVVNTRGQTSRCQIFRIGR